MIVIHIRVAMVHIVRVLYDSSDEPNTKRNEMKQGTIVRMDDPNTNMKRNELLQIQRNEAGNNSAFTQLMVQANLSRQNLI